MMKKGFSLVELIVVIGIIAILGGVLMVSFGGATDKARMAKCATNLKNLAAAVGSSAMGGAYPYAQSAQYVYTPTINGRATVMYNVHKGWISWQDQGTEYPLSSPSTFTHTSYASSDEDAIFYAITNGAIWSAVGKHRDCYVCPAHVKACEKAGVKSPGWSYQMSAWFGYEEESGKARATDNSYIHTENISRSDRRLLFAEIPALELSTVNKGVLDRAGITLLPEVNLTGADGDEAMDGCLHYKDKDGDESIGFNHINGNRIVGHVAFADGHVETITAPKNGNFTDLSDWLCRGLDVVYRDGSYEEINSEDENSEN